MDSAITRQALYPRRLSADFGEHFPVLGHGLLIVASYSSNLILAAAIGGMYGVAL